MPNLLQARILHCNLEPTLPVLGMVIVADGAGEPAHVFPRGLELAISLTVEVDHMVVGQSYGKLQDVPIYAWGVKDILSLYLHQAKHEYAYGRWVRVVAEGKNVDPGNPGDLKDGGTTRKAHDLAVYDLIYIAFYGHGNG